MTKESGMIITHPGNAHFDDLFSVCLVIYKCSIDQDLANITEVHRRKPEPQEMENSRIWKLDVGGKFNPELKQFDHHLHISQSAELTPMQRDLSKNCTFSLLLKEWGMWERAIKLFRWLPTAMKMDAQGPKKVVEELNISFNALAKLGSFIESNFLKLFQKYEVLYSSDTFFFFLHYFGKQFFEQLSTYYDLLTEIENNVEYMSVKDVPIIRYLQNEQHLNTIKKILSQKKEERWGEGGVVIYPNNRPPGSIAVMRYDDDERVDFTRIKDHKHVIFAHSNGFFAALDSNITDKELLSYLEDAILN